METVVGSTAAPSGAVEEAAAVSPGVEIGVETATASSSSAASGWKRFEVVRVKEGLTGLRFVLNPLCLLVIRIVDPSSLHGVEQLEGSQGRVVSSPVTRSFFPNIILSPISSLCNSAILLAFT